MWKMAAQQTIRTVTSAKNVLRLSSAVPRKLTPPVSSSPVQEIKDNLHFNFRQLTLSPVEAQLSAQFLASARTLRNTTELRLPSLLKPTTITFPTLYNGQVVEKDLPSLLNIMEKIEPGRPQQNVETPSNQVVEKQAARMIVIRRRKMKRHKLKKLRKKMKYVWAKVRQRREYRKEKLFQATQMAKVRHFETFNAVNYVNDMLKNTKEKPLPRTWKGKRLPAFLIKELMEKEEMKRILRIKEKEEMQELKKIKDNYVSKL